jgi:RsiW-degrading membrane proteinase PrsW (M82 family)
VYAYRTETFGTVVDGVVYGAMAGVGFAAIENLLYILMFSVQMTPAGFDVQQQQAIAIATQRAFTGPGHVIFSAWAGFYLGLAKFNHSKRGPIVVKGLMIAAFIHALYNTLVTTLPLSLTSFFAFIIVYHGFWFTLLYRKIRSYRSLYRQRGYRPQPPSN